jgi:Tfp pilus assembly protein PilO
MTPRALAILAAMPVRQLYLLVAGVLLIVGAAMFSVARPSFKALQAVRAERLQYGRQSMDGAAMEQAKGQLTADIARRTAGKPADSRSPEQLAVYLVGQLDRTSARRGVALSRVVPGAPRKLMAFDEIPFEVEAKGSYGDIIGWLQDLERSIDNLAVIRVEIRPGEGGRLTEMKARVALYR